MKRFVKLFSSMCAVLVGLALTMPLVKGMWPPVFVEPTFYSKFDEMFAELLKKEEPVATYCFFDPDGDEICPGIVNYMAYPQLGIPTKNIPVAICLWSDRARQVFDDYFLSEGNQNVINTITDTKRVDSCENVFIISLEDLKGFLSKSNVVCCTLGRITDGNFFYNEDWNWRRVVLRSRLGVSWIGPPSCIAPSYEHCRKVRILMDGLKSGKCGDAIRVFKGDSVVEKFIWAPYWGK